MATSITFSLVGDIKKATDKLRTHSIFSFSPNISSAEETVIRDVIATGTVDQVIPLGGISTAKMMLLFIDDSSTGSLKVTLNGGTEQIEFSDAYFVFNGVITGVSVSNDSGNDACLIAYFA